MVRRVLYATDTRGYRYPLTRTGDLILVRGGSVRLVDEIVFDHDPGSGRGAAFAGTNLRAADFAADGRLNVNDFIAFQAAFVAGCP